MSVSVSLLRPAMPTAPTTSRFTRIGTPPRSAMMSAVTKAVRPRLMLSSISAFGRCSRAAVRAFSIARSALAGRTPSIRWKASRSPAASTTAMAEGALRRCALSLAACRTAWAPASSSVITLMVCAPADEHKIPADKPMLIPNFVIPNFVIPGFVMASCFDSHAWAFRRHRRDRRTPGDRSPGAPPAPVAPTSGRLGELPVRIDDELARHPGVEVLVAFRRLLETDLLDIDDLGDGQFVPEDRLHELPVVFQHGRLAGVEAVRLCPAEAEPQAEVAVLGGLLLRTRIVRHIETRNADRTGRAGDFHQAVQHDRRRFDDLAVGALRLRFEAHAVDRTVDFRNAKDVGDELAQAVVPGEVDRLEADLPGVGEPLLVHVPDQHGCGAENSRGRRGREPDRPGAGDVDRRSDADLGGDGAMESGRQNIGQAGQIADLFHRLRLVGKLEQVEIGVRHHHVVGLPADPSTHVDISIGAAGAVAVDVKADAGVALPARPAAAARDVEG